jgi:predicted dehydrogenase
MNKKINYCVIGAGHLGTYHVQQLQNLKDVNLIGVYDIVHSKAKALSKNFNINCFKRLEDALDQSDAVSICAPASNHFSVAQNALRNGCHLFIEKPITDSLKDAEKIIKLNSAAKKTIQIGHIERFNPAFIEFIKSGPKPLFIESHRLSPYNVRGLDVPVILDLMIHDIELILSFINSDIKSIHASGARVVSGDIDLANARILFNNGCVANLTSSRISNKQMRQMRIFENKTYSVLDFQTHSLNKWVIEKNKNIQESSFSSQSTNPLYEELKSFINCLKNDKAVVVGADPATKALEIAIKIQKIIEQE